MFKDEIKAITLPQIEIPKLKGHTKIELTDVHTGKKEVIEHDNAFTDGLESYFRDLGIGRNNPLNNSNINSNYMWQYVLGGIYLFDTAIPSNAKYMPAGTSMVANGYYNGSNGGNPTELGTYNANESSFDNDTVTLVYDWLTSQGNGTIAAISLGTQTGGYIGYGNATSLSALSTKRSVATDNTYSSVSMSVGSAMSRNRLYYNNKIYMAENASYSSGTTTIKILANSFPASKIDVFAKLNSLTKANMAYHFDVTLPSALNTTYRISAACGAYKNKLMLFPNGSIANGSTVKLYLINVDTETAEEITFTNNTGASIYASNGLAIMLLDDTYALVLTGSDSGAIYKINYRNSAVIGEATRNGAITRTYANAYYYGKITDSLYLFGLTENYIYDAVKNAFFPTNGTWASQNSYSYGYIEDYDCLGQNNYATGSNDYFALLKNPLRLMTINNLDTPVEKTASKTMKVTYTITRATT